jgi:hypothetical protein
MDKDVPRGREEKFYPVKGNNGYFMSLISAMLLNGF